MNAINRQKNLQNHYKSEVKNHLAFAMYRSKCAVFRQKFFFKNAQKPSIYKALSHFCVISYEENEYLCTTQLSEF